MGGRAKLILNPPQIQEVFTTEHTLAEVEEYTPVLAEKRRLRPDLLLLAVAALPVTVVDRAQYSASLAEARKHIAHRDPDDIELLALALEYKIPLWSNDRDFEIVRVERFTTESLLRKLRIIR